MVFVLRHSNENRSKVQDYKDESGLQFIKLDFLTGGQEIEIAKLAVYLFAFITYSVLSFHVKIIKQSYRTLKHDISCNVARKVAPSVRVLRCTRVSSSICESNPLKDNKEVHVSVGTL